MEIKLCEYSLQITSLYDLMTQELGMIIRGTENTGEVKMWSKWKVKNKESIRGDYNSVLWRKNSNMIIEVTHKSDLPLRNCGW